LEEEAVAPAGQRNRIKPKTQGRAAQTRKYVMDTKETDLLGREKEPKSDLKFKGKK